MGSCLFLGSKLFGLRCLATIHRISPGAVSAIVTLDDSNDSRSALAGYKEASRTVAPLHILGKPSELPPLVAGYRPDMVFVCGWYWLIPPSLLATPPLGFVGLHFSLLPRYRGGAPVVWSMINGEKKTGFSLFKFDNGMDSGPLYAQHAVPIADEDYLADVLEKIESAALNCIERMFPQILEGTVLPREQPGILPTYAGQRRPSDGEIGWEWSQRRIYDFIRAQSHPYPGAFTWLDGKKIHIWRACPENMVYYGTPGQVLAFRNEAVLVACGDGRALRIEEVGVDGKAMPPRSILSTLKIRLGRERERERETKNRS
jgi:methionyl-tRNA formyltransferase